MRAIVYVDGFNLYFGALRKTPHRWLNLHTLASLLLPKHNITEIKYFTALVSDRPQDPGQPERQQTYLRALLPHTDFIKTIREGVLRDSQFSAQLQDQRGIFSKPKGW